MNARFLENLTVEADVPMALQETADGFTAVSKGSAQLVEQLGRSPRRPTALIPLQQQGKGLLVLKGESADKPTAHAEGMKVAVLARYSGRNLRQVSKRAFDPRHTCLLPK
jgi:hypothetical protein